MTVASAGPYASLHLAPDNHASTPPLSFFTGQMPFLPPNQQRQSTEGHLACKKTEWWSADVVICLKRGADLHMAQLMPLPLTVSCFSKSRLVLPFWYQLTRVVPDKEPAAAVPLNGHVCVCVVVQLTDAKTMAVDKEKYTIQCKPTTRRVHYNVYNKSTCYNKST